MNEPNPFYAEPCRSYRPNPHSKRGHIYEGVRDDEGRRVGWRCSVCGYEEVHSDFYRRKYLPEWKR